MENNNKSIAQEFYEKAKAMGQIPDLKKNIYAIKDVDQGFMCIMEQPNHMIALRTFGQMANDKNNPVGAHPKQHSLYFVGSYSNNSGIIVPEDKPIKLGEASAYAQNSND